MNETNIFVGSEAYSQLPPNETSPFLRPVWDQGEDSSQSQKSKWRGMITLLQNLHKSTRL